MPRPTPAAALLCLALLAGCSALPEPPATGLQIPNPFAPPPTTPVVVGTMATVAPRTPAADRFDAGLATGVLPDGFRDVTTAAERNVELPLGLKVPFAAEKSARVGFAVLTAPTGGVEVSDADIRESVARMGDGRAERIADVTFDGVPMVGFATTTNGLRLRGFLGRRPKQLVLVMFTGLSDAEQRTVVDGWRWK